LLSFVLYVFHNTGRFDAFDWAIFWTDLVAYSVLGPLFLHFCLEFPERKAWIERRPRIVALAYLPAALLLGAWGLFIAGVLGATPSPLAFRNLLDSLNDFHFGLCFMAGAAVLFHTS